jgi:hypothetical protein
MSASVSGGSAKPSVLETIETDVAQDFGPAFEAGTDAAAHVESGFAKGTDTGTKIGAVGAVLADVVAFLEHLFPSHAVPSAAPLVEAGIVQPPESK